MSLVSLRRGASRHGFVTKVNKSPIRNETDRANDDYLGGKAGTVKIAGCGINDLLKTVAYETYGRVFCQYVVQHKFQADWKAMLLFQKPSRPV